MSLTAFNRIRRMQQVEEMKPENIGKVESKTEVESNTNFAQQSEELKESTTRRRRRN